MYQYHVEMFEKKLFYNFESMFVDKKLNNELGENKSEYMLFTSKEKITKAGNVYKTLNGIKPKQLYAKDEKMLHALDLF